MQIAVTLAYGEPHLNIIVSYIITCKAYKPALGQGKSVSLKAFQQLYGADPFYAWFGPAYSVKLIGQILEQHPDIKYVLDPFSGSGTTGLVCAEMLAASSFEPVEAQLPVECQNLEQHFGYRP